MSRRIYKDSELRYAAGAKCVCGAGLAYPIDVDIRDPKQAQWSCSDCLTDRAIHANQPDAKMHDAGFPFAFYEIKSEDQPSAGRQTTRPEGAEKSDPSIERRKMEGLLREAAEGLAGRMYEAYCKAVGGLAFNGDALPKWSEFRADPSKSKQSDAWIEVALTK